MNTSIFLFIVLLASNVYQIHAQEPLSVVQEHNRLNPVTPRMTHRKLESVDAASLALFEENMRKTDEQRKKAEQEALKGINPKDIRRVQGGVYVSLAVLFASNKPAATDVDLCKSKSRPAWNSYQVKPVRPEKRGCHCFLFCANIDENN